VLKRIISRFTSYKKYDDQFKLLGYHTRSPLYKQAFTHKSINNKKNNEQLEFLGDAVLSFIITDTLLLENPNKDEGFLSKKRAVIISRKHLNLVGGKIIPKSKIKSNLNNLPENIFGNTLEAIIGAIYSDKGIQQTRLFIIKNIYNSDFLSKLINKDFKSQLLKYAQKKNLEIEYKTDKKQEQKHRKEFLVSVFLSGKKTGEAKAFSKKEAEQAAAKNTLNSL